MLECNNASSLSLEHGNIWDPHFMQCKIWNKKKTELQWPFWRNINAHSNSMCAIYIWGQIWKSTWFFRPSHSQKKSHRQLSSMLEWKVKVILHISDRLLTYVLLDIFASLFFHSDYLTCPWLLLYQKKQFTTVCDTDTKDFWNIKFLYKTFVCSGLNDFNNISCRRSYS